ncbi:MAG TPA: penicillin-binding protein 2 [Candidatus Omnitrophota bacterium]|nr:penicillin-binding protein 2 [Candidatus Omnitrophota bacterium]HPS36450.1 penicillin-binding protein 2 [Candidatus Omnitrophota bacterium]
MRALLSPRRFWFLYITLFVLFGLVIYQIFQLTYFHQSSLRALADRQHYLTIDVPPVRGPITDRTGKEFVTNLKIPSIYAVPRILDKDEREKLSQSLAKILGLDRGWLAKRLARDKSFVWIKRRVGFEEADAVKKLENPAIGIIEEYKRFYPQGPMLAQVLGFSNVDNQGLEGIELSMDNDLRGKPGKRITKRDAKGREIKAFEMKTLPAIDGNRIVLTIDQHLQYLAEKSLEQAFKQWKAKGAAAVVMDPATGEILAMANQPGFDPNAYDKSNADTKRNRAITDMYEPGSVFKIVTASGALNEEVVTPDTTIFCENGKWNWGLKVLHDVHPYGTLTMTDVIVKSSNIGTVKMGLKLGPQRLQKYIKGFGFGSWTGIDLAGEAPGYARPPSQWSGTSPYNIPMGQEIMVTALQMVTAMSVIANGGKLVKPYIMAKVEDPAGVTLKEKKPVIKQQVIRPEIAATMRGILTKVVDEGTGTKARIDGISVGGKTGTAQKILPGGKGYSHSAFMSSFVGFAPSDNPRYAMVVVLDEARPLYYGGTVAAPVFKEVIEAALLTQGSQPHRESPPPDISVKANSAVADLAVAD